MPGGRRWNYLYLSATDSINRLRRKLLVIPGVALETARKVERVGTGASRPNRDDDGLETVDRGEARAHLGDQIVLRHQKKVPAAMLRQTVGQFPLVLGKAAFQLPLDRIEGVRMHVVDQRRERLAIVAEQDKSWIYCQRGTDRRAEGPPAAQPAERVVFRRQL